MEWVYSTCERLMNWGDLLDRLRKESPMIALVDADKAPQSRHHFMTNGLSKLGISKVGVSEVFLHMIMTLERNKPSS